MVGSAVHRASVVLVVACGLAGCADPYSACGYPEYFAGAPPSEVETLAHVCGWSPPPSPPSRLASAPAQRAVQRPAVDVWPRVPLIPDLYAGIVATGVVPPPVPDAPPRPRDFGLCKPGPHGEPARGAALGVC